jgi:hypothetical protein
MQAYNVQTHRPPPFKGEISLSANQARPKGDFLYL